MGCSSVRASWRLYQGCYSRDSQPSWDTVLLHFPSCFCCPAMARCRSRWHWCYLHEACAASSGPVLCSPAFWHRTGGAHPSCSETDRESNQVHFVNWKQSSHELYLTAHASTLSAMLPPPVSCGKTTEICLYSTAIAGYIGTFHTYQIKQLLRGKQY